MTFTFLLQLSYITKAEQAGKRTQCNTSRMFTQLERLHFVIYTAGKEDQIL